MGKYVSIITLQTIYECVLDLTASGLLDFNFDNMIS